MNRKERIISLDVIKFIAVICVFTIHFTRTLEYFVPTDFKLLPDHVFGVYLGSWGVSLFFIASGFSLMYVYSDSLKLKDYFKKRFLNIYPLFWITYVFAFFINFYVNKGLDQTIPKKRILYTFIGFDGNLQWYTKSFYLIGEWFLGVIVCLYIIFPLLRLCVLKFPSYTVFFILLVFILIIQNYNLVVPNECFFVVRIPEFLFGMIFAQYIKRVRPFVFLISVFVLAATAFVDRSKINVMYLLPIVGISSFLVFFYIFNNIKNKLFTTISMFISKYCYSIFLSHHFIMLVFFRRFIGVTFFSKTEVIILYLMTMLIVLVCSTLLAKLNKNVQNSVITFITKEQK